MNSLQASITPPLAPWQQSLKAGIEHHQALTTEAWASLWARWTHPLTLERHDYLSQAGQMAHHMYWVLEGSFRIYHPYGAEEVCVGFCYPNSLAVSYPSFVTGQPASYYMQALNPAKLMGITRTDFYALLDEHPSLHKAWRKLTEQALLGKIERELEMLSTTPEERYRRLWARSPHVFAHIPQKFLASYLRMTPETFSRLKRKVGTSPSP